MYFFKFLEKMNRVWWQNEKIYMWNKQHHKIGDATLKAPKQQCQLHWI